MQARTKGARHGNRLLAQAADDSSRDTCIPQAGQHHRAVRGCLVRPHSGATFQIPLLSLMTAQFSQRATGPHGFSRSRLPKLVRGSTR